MNSFSNREISIVIWVVIFLVYALYNKKIRKSFGNLVKFAFQIKLIVPFVLLVAYVSVVVTFLNKVKLWDTDLIKETLIWFFLSGISLAFSFVSNYPEKGILKTIVVDNVKVIILLEFIVDDFTLSLPVELAIIPIMTFVIGIDAVAKMDEKYKSVANITTGIQSIFGLTIITFAIIQAINNYQLLGTIDSIRQIMLAPILSTALVPFIYILLVLTTYELLFLQITMNKNKEYGVGKYAKRRLISLLKLNLRKSREFLKIHRLELFQLRTKEDVDNLIDSEK
jgi:hypothetical protein